MPRIIHYREKCIGCNICFEMQTDLWRLSKKDGKATLINAEIKKGIHMLQVSEQHAGLSRKTAASCPVKIIKVV